VDYVSGILIESAEGRRRKGFLLLSIIANVGVLAIFKYFNFFDDNLHVIFGALGWAYPVQSLSIILPIGLSFHTFQSLSYTIEVYRHNQKAERHLGIFALYVMFYPQLVAGPIERPQNLLHQFREPHRFDYQRVTDGLKRMMWGLFKKAVIADRLAIVANQVYANPTQFTGPAFILGTLCFAYQIFCDFSGYSDIALGAAQVMGFTLMKNFDQPYSSASISEFWQRWHISLSTWFRDYLYIPLGGSRVTRWRWQINLLITFLVSGLWHGASWTYVVWGALHGVYLLAAIWTESWQRKLFYVTRLDRLPTLRRIMQITLTFTLVCFAWIFFRAASLNEAWYIVTHLFQGLRWFMTNLADPTVVQFHLGKLSLTELWPALPAIVIIELVHYAQRQHVNLRARFNSKALVLRWSVYYGLFAYVLFYGVFGKSQFIYFQF
jgi:D-alanyl-lipoteichoic acid acyltransferase DltB (MBOAT superfamily)